jgi:hypothetical protein
MIVVSEALGRFQIDRQSPVQVEENVKKGENHAWWF